ncbi:hypothetical protein [Clostridium hydrogeniformans]|uniref:hypothetical protein n=1 Tax=Clostridium hydrogeniformans TaxID=349933 RepID=UPI0004809EDC|nr:hypothetical protein [Clostridium hydrogeniformans]
MLGLLKVLDLGREDLYVEKGILKREGNCNWEECFIVDSGEGGFLDLEGNWIEDYLEDWKPKGILIDAEMGINNIKNSLTD